MSYQVLARKYRPKTFAEVVGQRHILKALTNGLADNRLHHAYLFSGTRGVGKTSIARLFAKGLNCEHGVSAEPCGQCEHCKAIEEGRFIDLIEIDAASRTKVEDTRELLENVQYKPALGRFKVYLIDEVHMLSRHSFNALLKTLEEPPEYVKFLLATTDPQKLPITILSRCMQFNLKALQPQQISDHLQHILQLEKIPFEPMALQSLAIAANGSLRDSLSLTDQAIALSRGHVTFEIVKQMLGILDETQPLAIISALHQGNGEQLMQAIESAASQSVEWSALLSATTDTLHKLALCQFLPQQDHNNSLCLLAKNLSPQDLQFFYQTLLKGQEELRFATNQRMATEMVLLRALAFHPKFSQNDFLASQRSKAPATQEVHNLPPKNIVSPVAKPQAPINNPTKQSQTVSEETATTLEAFQILGELVKEKKKTNPLNHSIIEKDKISPNIGAEAFSQKAHLSSPPAFSTPLTEIPCEKFQADEEYRWQWINPDLAKDPNETNQLSDIKQAMAKRTTPALQAKVIEEASKEDEWTKLVETLNIKGFLKEFALNSAKISQKNETLSIALRSKVHLLQKMNEQSFINVLREHLGKDLQITFEINDDRSLITPQERQQQIYERLCLEAVDKLKADSKLTLLLKEFDATLVEKSILPA